MQESAHGTPPLDYPSEQFEFDLSSLESSYDKNFLLALKEAMISLRHRMKLLTICNYTNELRLLLTQVHAKGFAGVRIHMIDGTFLATLRTIADKTPATYLQCLKRLYLSHQDDGRLFQNDLQPGDFPRPRSKRGFNGDRIHAILTQALRRSTLVHILDVAENAFEENRLDLDRYAFIKLALNIFCRPSSYSHLTLEDLRIDKDPKTGGINYFLAVVPAKSRVHNPQKIIYRLHPEVGRLLSMQRLAIVEKYGQLAPQNVDGPDYCRLALFPARRLKADGSTWLDPYASANYGRLKSRDVGRVYVRPIQKLAKTHISCNALRHTIGTQMAHMGCSASTIQAVLKHASDSVCNVYVDLAFQGLIEELSDALEPSFNDHFPVVKDFVKKSTQIPIERRIDSADLETNRVETTGMCGRHVACSYAPIACYACPRFVPCIDADHSINLAVVERELEFFEGRGHALQHDLQRWKTIRKHILLVSTICERKRETMATDDCKSEDIV
jgi:integrase